jgi:NOL1/NOP2/fmu family ribosome biogenesis protein
VRTGDPLKIFRAEMPGQAGHEDGLPHVNVDRKTALRYLHGDALRLEDAPIGLIKICYEGHPLGDAKNLGTRCNNLYPKAKRIRMQVILD